MEILSYLTELVKTRKEVGIPGLGTIYKKKSPGRYDVETHSFMPPSYNLNFTTDIKEQISFIDFISKKRNISSESATYYVDQFVENIKKELTDNQEANLGELGKLSAVSSELSFIPANESNIGFDFYGLPSVKEKEIIAEVVSDADIVSDNTEPTLTEEQLDLENNNADLSDDSNTAIDDNTIEVREQKMPVYLKVVIAMVIVLAVLIATYLINPTLFKDIIENSIKKDLLQTTNESNKLKTDSIAYADSIKMSNEQAILAMDSAKDSTAAKVAIIPPDTTIITYDIIAASLLNKREADAFMKTMKARNIPAKVADMPGKRVKISIGTFTDEHIAKEALETLKKTTRIHGIYIYTNRHTHK